MPLAQSETLTNQQTFRFRHVKCGEEKPGCFRCSSTGRVCDGYQSSSKCSPADTTKAFPPVHVNSDPNFNIFRNDQEHRGFYFFRFQVAEALAIALDSGSHWNRLILQASHYNSIVLHAAIAVGSLGERFKINNVLTSENAEANSRHEFARLQYCKAIGQLRDQLSSGFEPPLEITLFSCFLFCVFEFLQGKLRPSSQSIAQ